MSAAAQIRQRWNEANARERLLVCAMAVVVCGAILFATLVRPAWRVVQSAPATLTVLDAKVVTMRTQAAQLRGAPVAAGAVSAVTPQTIERDLAAAGATVTVTKDAVSNGHLVNLKGVDGARLASWLATPELQKQLQGVNLTRDTVSGRITGTALVRAAAPS